MADMGNTHHFDGDGCAVYYRGYRVESDRVPGGFKNVEDLEDSEVWRDPATDGPGVWWYADEVVLYPGDDGDEVHVECSRA